MGLGPYPDLSLSDARRLAEIGRGHVANGKNPKRERDAERVLPLTFALDRRIRADQAPESSPRNLWGEKSDEQGDLFSDLSSFCL